MADETGFATMGRAAGAERDRRDRRRDARLRVHGQGAHERLPDARRTWPGRRRCCRGWSRSRAATRRPSPRPRGATASSAHVTDWRALVDDPEIGLFDNGGPNDLHAEPTIAAAEAGKHVICEKPLGRDAAESYEIWQRVAAAGVVHMCAFNYRFVPAVRLARQMIEAGELGEIHHFRGRYLQEWGATSDEAWRFEKDGAGSGALGDLGTHVVDLARYLVGEIDTGRGADRHVPARARRSTTRSRRRSRSRTARSGRSRRRGSRRAARTRSPGRSTARRARSPSTSSASTSSRSASARRVPHLPRLRGRRPVLGLVVAARPHDRLGAHVRARAPSPARRRSPGDNDGRAARRDVRGRLPRGGGLRRDRRVGRHRRAPGPCNTARSRSPARRPAGRRVHDPRPRGGSAVPLKHPKAPQARTNDLMTAPLFSLETETIPRHELPEGELPPDVAYQLIHDELMLDGNARLNVATFVSTWMEPQAEKLMAECFDKNMIDKDEYPQTAEIESRCVNILSRLWHAPDADAGDGLLDDGLERGGDARRARAQAPLADAPRRGGQADRQAQPRHGDQRPGVLGEVRQLLGRRDAARPDGGRPLPPLGRGGREAVRREHDRRRRDPGLDVRRLVRAGRRRSARRSTPSRRTPGSTSPSTSTARRAR